MMTSIWDQRTNNFDFIRLALAVLVIFSHSFPLGTGSEAREPIRMTTHGQMTGGSIAVDLFFIMSGFLITASAERSSSVWSFLKKRVARIYPAFIACAVLTGLVVMPFAGALYLGRTRLIRVSDFVFMTLRLIEFHYVSAFQGNPFPGVINGSLWSVAFEFWCYIGVALLLSAGLLRRRGWMLVLFALALAVSIAFQVEGWILGGKMLGQIVGVPQFWARLLPLYLAGVVFYLYRRVIPNNGLLALGCAGALVAACWMRFGWTALFPLAGTYLVFYLAFTPAIQLHGFGRFGDFSYGTYLYAFPVQQMIMKGFGHVVSPGLLFVCATPVTLMMAALSWYLVERRFLKPGRRKETPAAALEASAAVQVLATSGGKTDT